MHLWRTDWHPVFWIDTPVTLCTLDSLTPYDTKGVQWLMTKRGATLRYAFHVLSTFRDIFTTFSPIPVWPNAFHRFAALQKTVHPWRIRIQQSCQYCQRWQTLEDTMSNKGLKRQLRDCTSHFSTWQNCCHIGENSQLCAAERVLECPHTHYLTSYSTWYLIDKTLQVAGVISREIEVPNSASSPVFNLDKRRFLMRTTQWHTLYANSFPYLNMRNTSWCDFTASFTLVLWADGRFQKLAHGYGYGARLTPHSTDLMARCSLAPQSQFVHLGEESQFQFVTCILT